MRIKNKHKKRKRPTSKKAYFTGALLLILLFGSIFIIVVVLFPTNSSAQNLPDGFHYEFDEKSYANTQAHSYYNLRNRTYYNGHYLGTYSFGPGGNLDSTDKVGD